MPRRMARSIAAAALLSVTLAACGGGSALVPKPGEGVGAGVPKAAGTASQPQLASGSQLAFPEVATKNTTRVSSSDPATVAAAVALAVFPSAAIGTHPTAVTLAPAGDWQAAIAAASLMAPPFRAPLLLSRPAGLPHVTANALGALAPTGAGPLGGAQLVRVGKLAAPAGLKSVTMSGADPYSLSAAIDEYEAHRRGRYATNVVVASAEFPQYAMPAAGYAAESGEPVLFVNRAGVPASTRRALALAHRPHIFVLGPPSVIPNKVLKQLGALGPTVRIGALGAAANAVAFTEYRDPPCAYGQACVHVPGSFGWAITSPGHGYVLLDSRKPLDAAAAAALSASGSYGPELLIDDPNTLPQAVLSYFLNFATPGYTSEGPTAAVYNHAWLIGTPGEISPVVQAQVDSLLEAVPQQ